MEPVRFTVHRGDITRLAVDAIVNAANESLLGGGGVDGAIHRAAGPQLLDACLALEEARPGVRCPAGEARLTPGFQLPARHVIHTVGPVWNGTPDDDAVLAACYRASLDVALAHGLRSVAFPAVSCGVYGFPAGRATALAVRTMRQHLASARLVPEITLVGFDEGMAAHWRRALTVDPAGGWDAIAEDVVRDRERTRVGADALRHWARGLRPGARVLDLGCGGGEPVSRILVESGALVAGVDASPRMIAEYRARFPAAEVECAAAETSTLLDRRFDAVVSIGLVFLLDASAQRLVIRRMVRALRPGGRLLFTAPSQAATWRDRGTGRESQSLGLAAYTSVLEADGLRVDATFVDEGGNHYYSAVKPVVP